jgi:hypothetical protein
MIRKNEFNASCGMIMPVGAIQLVQNSEIVAGSKSLCVTSERKNFTLPE